MNHRRRALVVAPNPQVSEPVTGWLAAAGYSTVVVREFSAARAELDAGVPDLVVTELKLGAYNGLHLAIRIRGRGWTPPIVVIGDADPVLASEASRLQTVYLSTPLDQETLFRAITQGTGEPRATRRSPRKQVPLLDALVDETPARVVDISYEGLRLQMPDEETTVPPYFLLKIPTFNVSCRVQRVWTRVSSAEHAMWCGAALVSTDPAAAMAWRTLVDSVPGWTLLIH